MLAYIGCRTTRERNARGRGLALYDVSPDGAWHHRETIEGVVNPSYLVMNHENGMLYSVHGDGEVASTFRVKPDGALEPLGSVPTGGRNPVHLVIHKPSRSLIVANYATGSVARLPIAPDGRLEGAAQILAMPGEPGPHRVEQKSSEPHLTLLDPTGNRVIVPDKGLDQVFVIDIAPDGALSLNANQPARGRDGCGPRHAVFHPSGKALFVNNELDSTVTSFAYECETGRLTPREIVSTLPPDCLVTSHTGGIALTPDGRWLYVSNRGHDSVTLLEVDPATLTARALGATRTGGAKPRFITLDPTGTRLVVAHENSDTIAIFAIDGATGALSATGTVIETGSPVCVLFVGEPA